jgi:stage II sporulation protein GA (sporulation sigma-E factor processing peptidase)
VPVELEGIRITALRDTGNTLTDPITGQQVLVVSAGVGQRMLGLTARELEDPVQVLDSVAGARLLPYHAVGKHAMLLVKRYENVRIGDWRGSCLVAFAPNEIGGGKPYEALTGGVS